MRGAGDILRILHEYGPRIRGYFAGRVSNPTDVEDLVQEAACAIIEGHPRFRGMSSLSTWIYAVCRNTLNTYYAKIRRSRDLADRLRADGKTSDAGDSLWRDGLLAYAYEKLPKSCRLLFDEYYRNRQTIAEVAVLLGKPEGTVKYLLYDLRHRLRRLLGEDE